MISVSLQTSWPSRIQLSEEAGHCDYQTLDYIETSFFSSGSMPFESNRGASICPLHYSLSYS